MIVASGLVFRLGLGGLDCLSMLLIFWLLSIFERVFPDNILMSGRGAFSHFNIEYPSSASIFETLLCSPLDAT